MKLLGFTCYVIITNRMFFPLFRRLFFVFSKLIFFPLNLSALYLNPTLSAQPFFIHLINNMTSRNRTFLRHIRSFRTLGQWSIVYLQNKWNHRSGRSSNHQLLAPKNAYIRTDCGNICTSQNGKGTLYINDLSPLDKRQRPCKFLCCQFGQEWRNMA